MVKAPQKRELCWGLDFGLHYLGDELNEDTVTKKALKEIHLNHCHSNRVPNFSCISYCFSLNIKILQGTLPDQGHDSE